MPKADRQLTKAKRFKDPRSFVFKDQREWLYGKDWTARKAELLDRCQGICEEVPDKVRCGRDAAHPHHIVKKSVAHDDRLSNLMGICEEDHRRRHPEKQPRWTKRSA